MATSDALRALMAAPQQRRMGDAAECMVYQHEGHPTVAFRPHPGAKHSAMIPNGVRVRSHGVEGEWMMITWGGQRGYVKKHNTRAVKPLPAPAPLPVPAPAAVAAPAAVFPTAAASGVCSFTVNGTQHSINPSTDGVDGMMTVHDWLQAKAPKSHMRRSCGYGYCGACVVMISAKDPVTGSETHRAFNSCLRPILSCNGMAITTAAGVGSMSNPHPTQKALAQNSGTQCGMCSVGMVMGLYSHLMDKKGSAVSESELENLLDGNVCRCTGYRPILDTYKSFASDAREGSRDCGHLRRQQVFDAGMQEKPHVPAIRGDIPLPEPALPALPAQPISATVNGVEWIEARTEAVLQGTLQQLAAKSPAPKDVWLVGGRTSQGLYGDRRPDVMVDIATIATLKTCKKTATGVWIGAASTMTDTIEFLEAAAAAEPGPKTEIFAMIAKHGRLAPGTTIRNMGTVGGNVAIVHEHQRDAVGPFPTEWPMLLACSDATVEVFDAQAGQAMHYSFSQFYAVDMRYKYIRGFSVPFGKQGQIFRSFKTGQRARYVHSYCAAAMQVVIGADGTPVKGETRVVYGGLGSLPLRMLSVEAAIEGGAVTDEARFQSVVLPALDKVVNPTGGVCSADYRRSLARSFLYKFYLALQPNLPAPLRSAAQQWLTRPVTKSSQAFVTDPAKFPVGEAIPKVDGLKQVTGQAQYVADIPIPSDCLHAAPVYTSAVGDIASVDPSPAQGMPGFVRFISAKDVPKGLGKGYAGDVFTTDKAAYIGQLVGVCLAKMQQQAVDCAGAVKITYANTRQPILTCAEALKAGKVGKPLIGPKQGDVDKAFAACDHVVEDVFNLGAQYHYHLEKQSVLAVPGEGDSIVVHSATQMPNIAASTVATCINRSTSDVEVRLRRCGGGFGGKLGNSLPPACAAALTSVIVDAPVRMIWEYADNLAMFGTRPGWQLNSKIGFSKEGKISAVKLNAYVNAGFTEQGVGFCKSAFFGAFDNCYDVPNWDTQVSACITDLPFNTAMRGPGWTPAIYNAERLVSVVAAKTGLPPVQVRELNFYQKGAVTPYGMPLNAWNIPDVVAAAKQSAGYDQRVAAVAAFNQANRWVKKGLSLVPSKFSVGYADTVAEADTMFDTLVKVNKDATVSVMTGGTEIGQGLTTKVAQTVAYVLGADLSAIRIQEQSTAVLMQNCGDATGGSISSENCCRAALNACDKINAALAPVRRLLPTGTFQDLVTKAYELGITLSAHETSTGTLPPVNPKGFAKMEYNTYGVAFVEVTLDVLTGQVDLCRADIVYDLGRSVNPDIDIGQVEGGFVMGLGMAATEEIEYDNAGHRDHIMYIPPTPWEMPGDFNVTLLKGTPNPYTVGGGKAIGEPPLTCSYALVEAISEAAAAACPGTQRLPVQLPLGPERRFNLCGVDAANFKFQ